MLNCEKLLFLTAKVTNIFLHFLCLCFGDLYARTMIPLETMWAHFITLYHKPENEDENIDIILTSITCLTGSNI